MVNDVRSKHILGSPRFEAMYLLRHALSGFLRGYVILHPVAMVIFVLLDARQGSHADGTWSEMVPNAVLHSFQLSMLPMGLAFGVFSAMVAIVHACQKQIITTQRDRLREQLARNDALVQELEHQSHALRDQNDRLLELERMKRRTTSFLVHDFKTQLNCIEGFSTLLLEEHESHSGQTPCRELLSIRRQAQAMLASVNNLLDISRLEDAPTLHKKAISPHQLLESASRDAPLGGRDVAIHVDPETRNCPEVLVDPKLISRVLINLVCNAAKHNRPGIRVLLGASFTDDGRHVRFFCQDDGQGIAPDMLEKLFSPYETGQYPSKESTGLGLAFAKSAVEAHGGRIGCTSNPGNGAYFYFTLPPERSAQMTEKKTNTSKHVLVVDDEPDFAALMESILRGQGYSVSVAGDGQQALELVRSRRPDVVTLDIQMPKKSGLLFYRQMKSDEALRDIPVIIITGLPNEDADWDSFIHSFLDVDHLPHPDRYLTKPVDRDKVAGVLQEVFSEEQQHA